MKSKINHHFNEFLNEFKAQIAEEVARSVIQVLNHVDEKGRSQDDVFLTLAEVASLFKVSKSLINNLRKKHSNFPTIKIGNSIRFKQADLEIFFSQLKNK